MSKYDFGCVTGDVNIVENGTQYNIAVGASSASQEIKELLVALRDAAADSQLASSDKQIVAGQLVEILDEIENPTEQRVSRFVRAVNAIKVTAEGARPVVDLCSPAFAGFAVVSGGWSATDVSVKIDRHGRALVQTSRVRPR